MISPYSSHISHQIWSRGVAQGHDPDIVLEILSDGLLHWQLTVPVISDNPMIDPPQMERSGTKSCKLYFLIIFSLSP